MNKQTLNSFLLSKAIFVAVIGLAIFTCETNVFGQMDSLASFEVNRRPFEEFAIMFDRKLKTREIDPDSSFSVTFKGIIGPNGRIDNGKSLFLRSDGEEKLVEAVKRFVGAIDDSGYFQYLSNMAANEVSVAVSQDQSQFSLTITGTLASERNARSAKSALEIMIPIAKTRASERVGGADKNDLILLNSVAFSNNQKSLIISVKFPKATLREIIQNEVARVK